MNWSKVISWYDLMKIKGKDHAKENNRPITAHFAQVNKIYTNILLFLSLIPIFLYHFYSLLLAVLTLTHSTVFEESVLDHGLFAFL